MDDVVGVPVILLAGPPSGGSRRAVSLDVFARAGSATKEVGPTEFRFWPDLFAWSRVSAQSGPISIRICLRRSSELLRRFVTPMARSRSAGSQSGPFSLG